MRAITLSVVLSALLAERSPLGGQNVSGGWQFAPWVNIGFGMSAVSVKCGCTDSPGGPGVFAAAGAGVYFRPELSIGIERSGGGVFLTNGENGPHFTMLTTQVSPRGGPLAMKLGIGRARYARYGSALVDDRPAGQAELEFDAGTALRRLIGAAPERAKHGSQETVFLAYYRSQRGSPRPSGAFPVQYWISSARLGVNLRVGILDLFNP